MKNMSITRVACLVIIFLGINFKSSSAYPSSPAHEPTAPESEENQSSTRAPEVGAGFSYEGLTNGFSDWFSFYVDALKEFNARTWVHATLRQTQRFSLTDQELSAGVHFPIERTWGLFVEGSGSPSHLVLPRWSAIGQLERLLWQGWIFYAGFRHTEYQTAATNSGIFTIDSYWGNNRASYSFFINQLVGGGTVASHVLQVSYYYSDLSSLNLLFAIGRELENLQPLGVLSSHIRSLVLWGRHGFADHWAIVYEILVHEQGDIYTRKGFRIGLRYLF